MAVSILVPGALLGFTDGQNEVKVSGGTVGEALDNFISLYPDLTEHLYESPGELRSFINVYVEDTNIRETGGLATPISEITNILLIPAIAGGRR
jgi:adenylyltransferase/sulfurtransferase